MDGSKSKRKIWIRLSIFLVLGGMLFLFFQHILKQVWNRPTFFENPAASLSYFYSQREEVDQVLFLGTSHSEFGVSPMEIYEDSGIVSYNISTSAQPVEVSYYLLESAFETQSPEVVVLDASSLFFGDDVSDLAWRYVMDGMPFGSTKIAMAREYAMLRNNTDTFTLSCEADFVNSLVPMFQYHTRWSELLSLDFEDVWSEKPYALAGYCLYPYRSGSIAVDEMNEIMESLQDENTAYTYTYEADDSSVLEENGSLYTATVTERKRSYLKKMQKLCTENGAILLLVKYPTINNPIYYGSAWTSERAKVIKKLADEMGLDFLDFVYDVDYDFDYTTDFGDGGGHCNYLGAKKNSLYLSSYLQETYGLEGSTYEPYEENRVIYDKLTKLALLQLSADSEEIFDYLIENQEEYIICIAAQDDMENGLSEEEMDALHALGLQADYEEELGFQDSYLAVLDGKEVLTEKLSNRRLYETCTIEKAAANGDDLTIELMSSGYLTYPDSKISIDGTDYSMHGRGTNIVLIDKETSCVVMSKCIDTFETESHPVSSGDNLKMLQDYWEEMLK